MAYLNLKLLQILKMPLGRVLLLSTFLNSCASIPWFKESVVAEDGLLNLALANRVARIFYGQKVGSGFFIEVDGRQYLITARHVIEGYSPAYGIGIQTKKEIVKVPAKLVGTDQDVAVLALKGKGTDATPLKVSFDWAIGRPMQFLGFLPDPRFDAYSGDSPRPVPLLKTAICSGLLLDGNRQLGILLDGINSPGFSGGPVVRMKGEVPQVIAVISGYSGQGSPIKTADGAEIPGLFYQHNTGIIHAYSIQLAVDLIKANPIGFPIN